MLTRRGWTLGIGSVAMSAAGRLFGIVELHVLAASSLVLLVAATVYVRTASASVDARRDLHPPRVPAGSPSRVDLALRNTGTRRTPVLAVRDPFDRGWRWARFLVAPLRPGASSNAAYRLPTDERGIFEVGPLEIVVSDPFGLASTTRHAAPATQLTVYPHIDTIAPLPLSQGTDPHAGSDHPTPMRGSGDDFFALRAYEVGDDLRRVHWPSTARLDDLMVRQDEMPWQGRATIVIDLRDRVHSPASLERAVSAAASIVQASWNRRSLVRLVSTGGTDSGFAAGHPHVEAIMEQLALAEAGPGDFSGVLTTLHRAGNGGSLAVVTTSTAGADDLEDLSRLRRRFGRLLFVVFDHPGAPVPVRPPSTGTVIRVPPGQPFASAWDDALLTASVGRR